MIVEDFGSLIRSARPRPLWLAVWVERSDCSWSTTWAHLRRVEDPEYAEELARRHRDMEGQKVAWSQIKRMHQDMLHEGL